MKYSLKIDANVNYYVERSHKRKKNIAIVIDPVKGIVVYAPILVSEAQIHAFVEKQSHWIIKHWHSNQSNKAKIEYSSLKTGSKIYFLGQPYTLLVEIATLKQKKSLCVFNEEEAQMLVFISNRVPPEGLTECIFLCLKSWYIKQAEAFLTMRTQYYAKCLGVTPNKILIRSQKARWGSCDRDNNIRYNWQVMTGPPAVIDYLVVHELCHIRIRNHSKSFWRLVATVMPDYNEHRAKLHKEGPLFWLNSGC